MRITWAGLSYNAILYVPQIISMTRMSCKWQRSVYPRHITSKTEAYSLKQLDNY